MLVISTGRRADVRRSTSGWPVFSSQTAQAEKASRVTAKDVTVHRPVQPHACPLEMPSNKAVKAIKSETAPREIETSWCPDSRLRSDHHDEDEHHEGHRKTCPEHRLPTKPAVEQSRQRRPTAAPTPSVALIRATAPPMRSGGSWSRMVEIPMGISAGAKPCSARDNQRPQGAADGSEEGPGDQDHQRDDDDPSLVVHVGELGGDWGGDHQSAR